MNRLVLLASEMTRSNPDFRSPIFQSLREPFVLDLLSEVRQATLFEIAATGESPVLCLEALEAYGPWIPWDRHLLTQRVRCLEALDHPQLSQARSDLDEYLSRAPFPLETGLQPD